MSILISSLLSFILKLKFQTCSGTSQNFFNYNTAIKKGNKSADIFLDNRSIDKMSENSETCPAQFPRTQGDVFIGQQSKIQR